MPHSLLAGRPLPETGERLWLAEDLVKAKAWLIRERDRCKRCGTFRSEWFGPDGKELEDLPLVVAELVCPGCEQLDMHEEENRGAHRHGIHIAFRPPEAGSEEPDDAPE